eukprot:TRINITY_DN3075_c0_g1_i4.p2 TRINITY_DN3075_c0_g1~~TRINITY_DN3075_c0_g1_i4.p2  ORF type:complete len:100 (+),score=12.61 TRINITY_DN3075_c0_g1_i4:291-590(+)
MSCAGALCHPSISVLHLYAPRRNDRLVKKVVLTPAFETSVPKKDRSPRGTYTLCTAASENAVLNSAFATSAPKKPEAKRTMEKAACMAEWGTSMPWLTA